MSPTNKTIIPARFCGPPNIGHGGYVAALLAEGVIGARADAVQVTLRKPSPLDVELKLTDLDGGKRALVAPSEQGEIVTAELEPAQLVLDVPAPPSLEVARAAEA